MGYSDFVVQVRKEGTLLKSIKKLEGEGKKRCSKCGRLVPVSRLYASYTGDGPAKHPLAMHVCDECAPTKMDASDIMLASLFRVSGLKSQRPRSTKRRSIR
jgi:hypothetical protein